MAYNTHITKERTELMNIIVNGENNAKKQNDQQYAKNALQLFYNKLKNAEIEKTHIAGFNFCHSSYIPLLMKVKIAFMKNDYIWVCHELQNLVHFEDIFQSRIKTNVLKLLEKHIEME